MSPTEGNFFLRHLDANFVQKCQKCQICVIYQNLDSGWLNESHKKSMEIGTQLILERLH